MSCLHAIVYPLTLPRFCRNRPQPSPGTLGEQRNEAGGQPGIHAPLLPHDSWPFWVLPQGCSAWGQAIHHLSEWPSPIHPQTTRAGEDVEKGDPRALLVGMRPGAATVGTSMERPTN